MKFHHAVFALLGLACIVAHAKVWGSDDFHAMPTPGALSLSVNTTSINNLMQTFVPIMAYFALNNKTFDLNVEQKSILYKFTLKQLHIIEASGFTEKKFEYIPGTDKLHVRIAGINVSTTIDADLEALYFIPFKSSAVNITNLGLDFTIESTDSDGVHWKLADVSKITLDSVDIKMENAFLDGLVKLCRSVINVIIKDALIPQLGKYIDSEIETLNKMVASEGPYTFVAPIHGKDVNLNLTMTTAPRTKEGSDLVEVFFDGLFDAPEGTPNPYDFAGDITDYPPRLQHSLSEQFWIHEDTFDSLLKVASEELFPVEVNSASISTQLLQVFSELRDYYGQNVTVSLKVGMKQTSGKAVTFDMHKGLLIGMDDKAPATAVIDIVCTNATVTNETAVTFETNLKTQANLTMFQLIAYPHIDDISVTGTKVTLDKVGMFAHKYDDIFTNLAKKTAGDINTEYVKGWPLANLNPQIGMLGGLLQNTTMSPYITDGWMFAGFEMFADLPTAPAPQALEFIE